MLAGQLIFKVMPRILLVVILYYVSVLPLFGLIQGFSDGFKAIDAADRLGFGHGTTIYFAVDFDALGHHITNRILPYLIGARNALDSTAGEAGKLSVYGPRSVCIHCR